MLTTPIPTTLFSMHFQLHCRNLFALFFVVAISIIHVDHVASMESPISDIETAALGRLQAFSPKSSARVRISNSDLRKLGEIPGVTISRQMTFFDSSRVFTLMASVALIVYGSFRSLNLEVQEREKQTQDDLKNGEGTHVQSPWSGTLNTYHALLAPFGASITLLFMFVFLDSLQVAFALCSAVTAILSFTFLLLPMCQYFLRTCCLVQSTNRRGSRRMLGPCSAPELLSLCLSFTIVAVWMLTGHWILMNALAMALCVAFIALVRLPSLKVSTLLLVGLLFYDVFWVFLSPYIFSSNVMVTVASRAALNPVRILAQKLRFESLQSVPSRLSLPGKLVFPSHAGTGAFSILGLGDVVMPGLLLCFVLRYDAHRKSQLFYSDSGVPQSVTLHRVTYFHCSLIGYCLGLITAAVSAEVFRSSQPALLYLVPFTLLPLFLMAYFRGDLYRMWTEPFKQQSQSHFFSV